MDVPTEAIATLQRATARSKRESSVAFPISYVRSDSTPPAAVLLRSHELRLKMHMTFVMQATRAPRTLPDRPSSTLARMLNLPEDTGRRQANDAKVWLGKKKLVKFVPLKKDDKGLLLLHPDGSGKEWPDKGARYITVPLALWSNAWILRLSGRSIVVLMALLELNGGSKDPDGALMDGFRKKQYGLSDDTWTRATKELEHFGLIKTKTVRWGDDDHERRIRKRYLVIKEGFDRSPDWSATYPEPSTKSGL